MSYEPEICKISFPLADLPPLSTARPAVVLWTYFSELTPFLPHFSAVLTDDETVRATRFVFDRDRQRWIIGRGLLRYLLAHYLGAPPSDIKLSYGEYDKPSVIGLEFNLAHAADLLIYAFSPDKALGVDIEPVRPLDDLEKIVEHFFAPSERELILAAPLAERPPLFFRHWTLKEAFIKATGKGLNLNLTDFTARLGSASAKPSICANTSDLATLVLDNFFCHEFTVPTSEMGKTDVYWGALCVAP